MKKINITITQEQYDWLKDSPYNVSALFREKIREVMDGEED